MFRKNEIPPDYESFTLFDSKSRTYREPMLAINADEMVRQIQSLFLDPKQAQNVLVTNPEDFSLFKIGTFSKKTGEIVSINHEHIANIHDLRPQERPEDVNSKLLKLMQQFYDQNLREPGLRALSPT